MTVEAPVLAAPDVPETNRTSLGLYVTPTQAYAMWSADPELVHVLDDPGSVYHGKHMRNGWKDAGLPWGYEFHPDLMWVAEPELTSVGYRST
jgi:hypothetical protein